MTERHKILWVSKRATQYLTPFASYLDDRAPGIAVLQVYGTRSGLNPYEDSGFGVVVDWHVGDLPGEVLVADWRSLPGVVASIVRFRPTAVVVFGWAGVLEFVAVLAGRLARQRVFLFSDSQETRERKGLRSALGGVRRRFFYRWVDDALAVGAKSAQFHAFNGLPDKAVHRFGFPVPEKFFSVRSDRQTLRTEARERIGASDDEFIVTQVGKLTSRKRAHDLCEAVEVVNERGTSCRALLIGDGPLRGEIESRYGGLAIVTGFVEHPDVPEMMIAADAAALCSETEPFGVVLAEAAVLGLPTLASTAVGACGDTESPAERERNAIEFDVGDVMRLADEIERLATDPGLVQRMAAESDAIGARYSFGALAQDLIQVLETRRR